ncbi:transcriptional regulator [Aspergillus flavus]|uniref:Transcriptional regulator n=1 Tax=Aspergillus flavus TaxID=5059 RepID=A0AB74BW40_ASPFL|nr:transcriptional regulator [Aspergillus flavus]
MSHLCLTSPAQVTTNQPPPQLRAHIAKQNPQVKAMLETLDGKPSGVLSLDQDVLVIFNGQHDHYVTPKYYTETKPDTGKVVPTWNYSAVQIYGKLSLYYDSKTPDAGSFLTKQMHDLLEQCEKYYGVYGIEGKFKMSQEMRRGDRDGVVRGFADLGGEAGEAISALVKERGELHDKKIEKLKAAKAG